MKIKYLLLAGTFLINGFNFYPVAAMFHERLDNYDRRQTLSTSQLQENDTSFTTNKPSNHTPESEDDDNEYEMLEDAYSKEKEGKGLEGLNIINRYIETHPNAGGDIYTIAAKFAFKLEKYREGLTYCEGAIKKYRRASWQVYRDAGYAAFELMDYQKALDYYEVSIEKIPDGPWESYAQAGRAAFVLKQYPKALDYFMKVLSNMRIHIPKRERARLKRLHFASMIMVEFEQSQNNREEFYRRWIESLDKTYDKETAKQIANFIMDDYRMLNISEEHPLVQKAIQVGILLDNGDDPLNPYGFHKKLLEKRTHPIDFSEIDGKVYTTSSGLKVQLNPEFFQKELTRYRVTYKDLPPYRPTLLQDLFRTLEERVSDTPNLEEAIQETTLFNLYQLKTPIRQEVLQALLHRTGQPADEVPILQVRLIELMNYIAGLSTEVPVGQQFSEQEAVFIRVLAVIQNCPAGQEKGLNAAYFCYVPGKKALRGADNSDDELETAHLLAGLSSVISTEVEKMFSGQNPFIKEATGLNPREKLQQESHQTKYLLNLIGAHVGARDSLSFDLHTNTLYKDMVDRPKLEVLQLFYKHFGPEKVIRTVMNYANLDDEEEAIEHLLRYGVLKEVAARSGDK